MNVGIICGLWTNTSKIYASVVPQRILEMYGRETNPIARNISHDHRYNDLPKRRRLPSSGALSSTCEIIIYWQASVPSRPTFRNAGLNRFRRLSSSVNPDMWRWSSLTYSLCLEQLTNFNWVCTERPSSCHHWLLNIIWARSQSATTKLPRCAAQFWIKFWDARRLPHSNRCASFATDCFVMNRHRPRRYASTNRHRREIVEMKDCQYRRAVTFGPLYDGPRFLVIVEPVRCCRSQSFDRCFSWHHVL